MTPVVLEEITEEESLKQTKKSNNYGNACELLKAQSDIADH